MRNLLALLGLALVLFFGIGYFRGWYTFNFATGTDGKTNISIGVDRTKVGGDLEDWRKTAGEKIDQLKTTKTDGQVQPAGGTQTTGTQQPVVTSLPPAAANLPAPHVR
ncbi:hypothetical protein [Limnoglobus roseus]|uniref:Uncharacterized protein n=1 Tax=Limnoglobus roseus TaxID=2598579 RepID=A0A5C1ABY9_9BACT|nr:hypothetical protein [Limnoglobus roseus]QEL15707.1 hypothetical protein PX52LOC_02642 [Limnoglobus roseus]